MSDSGGSLKGLEAKKVQFTLNPEYEELGQHNEPVDAANREKILQRELFNLTLIAECKQVE